MPETSGYLRRSRNASKAGKTCARVRNGSESGHAARLNVDNSSIMSTFLPPIAAPEGKKYESSEEDVIILKTPSIQTPDSRPDIAATRIYSKSEPINRAMRP